MGGPQRWLWMSAKDAGLDYQRGDFELLTPWLRLPPEVVGEATSRIGGLVPPIAPEVANAIWRDHVARVAEAGSEQAHW